MSNESGKPPTIQVEFEESWGQVLTDAVRDQMREGVAALRGKLNAVRTASEKAAAAERAGIDDCLRSHPAPNQPES